MTTEGEKKPGRWESALRGFVCVVIRNDTAVGAHCGRADQGPEMDPRRRSRLVERTAVGEAEAARPGWVRAAKGFICPKAPGAPIYNYR